MIGAEGTHEVTTSEAVEGLAPRDHADSRSLLAAWNDTRTEYPRDKSVGQLFEEQAARAPSAVALSWEGWSVRYEELNARANQLAHLLRRLGVGAEAPVGIFMERSPTLILCVLAICKAGGSYVPLDTSYPRERVAFMLQDAGVRVILTQARSAAALPAHDGEVVRIEDDWAALDGHPIENPSHVVGGEQRAYIMYTSGSTGRPKGVEILHRGISRLVLCTNHIQFTPEDRVAQVSNASFDAATFEIWGALLNGAQLCGIPRETILAPHAFARQIREQGITVMLLTVALFNMMAREEPTAFRSMRSLLVGGDALSPRWIREVLRRGPPERLLNEYGPTESTTSAAWYLVRELPEDATNVPIGRPLSNTQVHILDEQLRPVPIGAVGELYIGGDGLARGYVNQPQLTRERFVPDPAAGEQRLYRTGDLGRWLPEGVIEFLGRADDQVKIRGFRIELGEIEAVLAEHPAVQACAVQARGEEVEDKRLVAYLAPAPGDRQSADLVPRLREHLLERLPRHMIPAAFVLLEELPLTPNGKVDRRALPEPEQGSRATTPDRELARTPVEEELLGIWTRVLGLEGIGVHDDFLSLGGHSLKAAEILAKVKERFHVELPMNRLFEAPTVAELARQLEQDGGRASPPRASASIPRIPRTARSRFRTRRPSSGSSRSSIRRAPSTTRPSRSTSRARSTRTPCGAASTSSSGATTWCARASREWMASPSRSSIRAPRSPC